MEEKVPAAHASEENQTFRPFELRRKPQPRMASQPEQQPQHVMEHGVQPSPEQRAYEQAKSDG